MKKYLILNADDYGLCYAANEAVQRLFDRGFVTTTTLMTPCPWAEDAALRALSDPRMTVGLHITTTNEYARYKWGPVDRSCASLMDDRGYLYPTARESLAHATAEDMEKEINAQYDWMASRGLPPEHADSHMATVYGYLGPSHMEAVFRLCAAHGLNFRMPRMPETFVSSVPPELKAMMAKVSEIADSLRVGLPNGLFTCDFDVKPGDTYEGFRKYYLSRIEQAPDGVSELFMHPCIETEELKYINPQWQKRVWEYQLLQDDEVLRFIQRQGIELTTYAKAPFFAE